MNKGARDALQQILEEEELYRRGSNIATRLRYLDELSPLITSLDVRIALLEERVRGLTSSFDT